MPENLRVIVMLDTRVLKINYELAGVSINTDVSEPGIL